MSFHLPSYKVKMKTLLDSKLVLKVPVKQDWRASHDRCTCSTHGENEHSVASCLSIFAAEGMANQGWGRSKNTESALPINSSGNPLPWMSLTPTLIKLLKPVLSKSSLQNNQKIKWTYDLKKYSTFYLFLHNPCHGKTTQCRECNHYLVSRSFLLSDIQEILIISSKVLTWLRKKHTTSISTCTYQKN